MTGLAGYAYADALVGLEVGVAAALGRRLPGAEPLVDPLIPQRGALILQAAHTFLPEADVQSLPAIAQEELVAGLDGALRRQFAEYEVPIATTTEGAVSQRENRRLDDLTARLLVAVGGGTGIEAVLRIVTHIHLARAARNLVPMVVANGCLAWYGGYVPEGSSMAGPFRRAADFVEEWVSLPQVRGMTNAEMEGIARATVGAAPTDLLNISV